MFIIDGATWLRNWIDDAYPKAISILDYYHASGHLHGFTDIFFKAPAQRQAWCSEQKSGY
ncbi:MAG: hypothetical protein QM640_02195 [Niabella sp.]